MFSGLPSRCISHSRNCVLMRSSESSWRASWWPPTLFPSSSRDCVPLSRPWTLWQALSGTCLVPPSPHSPLPMYSWSTIICIQQSLIVTHTWCVAVNLDGVELIVGDCVYWWLMFLSQLPGHWASLYRKTPQWCSQVSHHTHTHVWVGVIVVLSHADLTYNRLTSVLANSPPITPLTFLKV